MALKHLLNDDDVDNFYHGRHSQHLNWCQQDSSDQYAIKASWSEARLTIVGLQQLYQLNPGINT